MPFSQPLPAQWIQAKASDASGACIDAPSTAAAPTMAYAPIGEPGQASDQANPSSPPSTAPLLSVGVNSPPDAPLPRQSAVTSGLRMKRAESSAIPPFPMKTV
jgi:hypothetical protein